MGVLRWPSSDGVVETHLSPLEAQSAADASEPRNFERAAQFNSRGRTVQEPRPPGCAGHIQNRQLRRQHHERDRMVLCQRPCGRAEHVEPRQLAGGNSPVQHAHVLRPREMPRKRGPERETQRERGPERGVLSREREALRSLARCREIETRAADSEATDRVRCGWGMEVGPG